MWVNSKLHIITIIVGDGQAQLTSGIRPVIKRASEILEDPPPLTSEL
jgi:hypothetical protein